MRYGIFIGTEKFVKKIKKRYLPDMPHAELPAQKQVVKDVNLNTVLSRAAGLLKCDLNLCQESTRISEPAKTDRDMLVYIAWQLGVATNQQIGDKFGLTYSAVSQRVRIFKEKLKEDRDLNAELVKVKSLIKI